MAKTYYILKCDNMQFVGCFEGRSTPVGWFYAEDSLKIMISDWNTQPRFKNYDLRLYTQQKFSKCISDSWNTHSRDLNSGRCVQFLRWYSLHRERIYSLCITLQYESIWWTFIVASCRVISILSQRNAHYFAMPIFSVTWYWVTFYQQ